MLRKHFRIGGRSLHKVSRALSQSHNYIALVNMFRISKKPIGTLFRYVFSTGTYPDSLELKTPVGPCRVRLYNESDVLTLNEVFFRRDYPASEEDKIVVDFGSNIGISVIYFLTNTKHSFVYAFEPLPSNAQKLRENLSGFEDRYELSEVAVGLEDGEVEFGFEETGRLGGIGNSTGSYILVKCRKVESVIAGILTQHPQVDVLKIDIEGLEGELLCRVPHHFLERIKKIYLEWNGDAELLRRAREHLAGTHELRGCDSVAHFTKLPNGANSGQG